MAVISPEGKSETTNTFNYVIFDQLYDAFEDHTLHRFLVVQRLNEERLEVIDLWQTDTIFEYPYYAPYFIKELFTTVDQAVGYCAFNFC
jgi:hypothetical protein